MSKDDRSRMMIGRCQCEKKNGLSVTCFLRLFSRTIFLTTPTFWQDTTRLLHLPITTAIIKWGFGTQLAVA